MPALNGPLNRKVFEFIRDLYTLRSWDDLTIHIVNSIPALIPTDICSYNEMSSRRHHAAYKMWPHDREMIPDAPEILGKFTHQHPIVTHMEQTKDFSSRKITDFLAQRQFRRTDLFNELYRPMRIPYCMGAALALNKDCLVALGLNRDGKDFTENDLNTLETIRPHVVQAFGNAVVVTTMQAEMAAFNRALEELGRAVLCVSRQGRILWSTSQADQLLADYGLQGKRRSEWLPTPLREWFTRQNVRLDSSEELSAPIIPLKIDRNTQFLNIRLVRNAEQRLIFLEEYRTELELNALAKLGLSTRETEVLGWLAQGKSNPEIGVILGISPRTVQKHLERIYGRLGVENRHVAMRVALETMKSI